MAEKLEFDTAPAPVEGERKLEFDTPSREQEIRRERLQRLLAAGEPGFSERLKGQVTSGVMQPIGGVMSVIEGKLKGSDATAGELYRGGVGAEEDYRQRAIDNTSKGWKAPLGVATDVVGSLVGGGKSTGPASLGKQMLQSGVQGAIEGASNNAKDVGSAAGGAVVGGGLSAGTTGILGALLGRFKDAVTKKDLGVASRGGSGQQMKTDAGEIFETLKDAGIKYSAKEAAPLTGNVVNKLVQEGFNPNMHKQLIPVLEEIGGTQGRGMTWAQLRNMQTQISDLKASPDPRLRRIAGELADEVDNFLNTAKPTMPAASVAAGVNPAKDVNTAKELYASGKHSAKIEGMAEVAAKADDPGKATQSVFQKYSDNFTKNPGKFNPNNPEQRRLIDTIAEGSPKTAAAAKSLDRWGNNLLGYGTAGAVGGAALPFVFNDEKGLGSGASTAGLAAIAAGLGAKGASGGLKRMIAEQGADRVNDLLRNIATGSTKELPGAYVPRELLAKIIASRDAARGAGNYAASFVNEKDR
jgi:hypothetical protein